LQNEKRKADSVNHVARMIRRRGARPPARLQVNPATLAAHQVEIHMEPRNQAAGVDRDRGAVSALVCVCNLRLFTPRVCADGGVSVCNLAVVPCHCHPWSTRQLVGFAYGRRLPSGQGHRNEFSDKGKKNEIFHLILMAPMIYVLLAGKVFWLTKHGFVYLANNFVLTNDGGVRWLQHLCNQMMVFFC
jgi:hypothetical protein